MDDPNLVGEFLRARRGFAQPADVGLGDDGRRRVQGLRREEVAMLAGVSIDYYNRLEQGRDRHPSPEVITALARVFDLDEDSVAHLRELARPMRRRSRRPAVKPERIRPALLAMLA
jgi:transcriptional regulator with XRE-family HTH domain